MSSMDATNISIETFKEMFKEGKRFDGRGLFDLRELEVSYEVSNKAEGSARVKLGKTEVIAGVKLALGEPYPDSPDKGNLMVSGDLITLASPRFESGPPRFGAIELPRLIDRAVRESSMIDLKKLVVTPGEKVWTVFIDVYPINDDGNLIDVANIACIAALSKTSVPKIVDGKVDYKEKTSQKIPLLEGTLPLSFSFFKIGESIIADPTREEEEATESRITFGISKWNKQYMINSCQKSGKTPFTRQEIEKIASMLNEMFDKLNEKLKRFL